MTTDLFIVYSGKDYYMVRRIIAEITNSFHIKLVEVDIDCIDGSIVRSIIRNETLIFIISNNSIESRLLYQFDSRIIRNNGTLFLHIDNSKINQLFIISFEKEDIIEWNDLSFQEVRRLREWTQQKRCYNNSGYDWEQQLERQEYEEHLNAEKRARIEAERKAHLLEEELTRIYEERRKIIEELDNLKMVEKDSSLDRESSFSYSPYIPVTQSETRRVISRSLLFNIFGKRQSKDNVYGSIYAPAEIKPYTYMQVQVYLHLSEETKKVEALALESDKNAERRDYIPLQCKLKKGDKVDVLLNIYGEILLMSEKKNVIWQGSFTKCSFDYFVPKDIDVDELSCVALLTVNGIPVGEMRFITKIVESPRQLNPEINAHRFNKVFISYAHKDEAKVKSFHEGLKLAGIEHFFDRAYLKTGDIYPQVIKDYINSADLFVLFWSENASKSKYVDKERKQALKRAFPQVKPQQKAKLSIYPMSIEPRAELPSDMKDYYHFGEI